LSAYRWFFCLVFADHNVIFIPYVAGEEADTLDAIFRGDKVEVESERQFNLTVSFILVLIWLLWLYPECVALWTKEGKGLMAHKFASAFYTHFPN